MKQAVRYGVLQQGSEGDKQSKGKAGQSCLHCYTTILPPTRQLIAESKTITVAQVTR